MPDNLPELRDIHLPSEGVSAFPLAYGWYVLILALIGLWLLWRGFLILRRKSKKRYAFRLLSAYPQNNIESAVQMSNLLRRICVLKFPQATALFTMIPAELSVKRFLLAMLLTTAAFIWGWSAITGRLSIITK